MQRSVALCLLAAVALVNADVYLQFPRGSNNRLSEANRDRNNGNRLFDSQNNDRGGYNVGQVYFYEGTDMHVSWTNQHSCGGPNNHCEMIIQYACDDLIRDGSTTNTIPTNADKNPAFGRHESWDSYSNGCMYRSRNKGLFTSNQDLRSNQNRFGAIYTRQNDDGTRRGYECPEERDYYPYWHPTMWRDIAVLTNEPHRCASYRAESQNVKGRYYCKAPQDWISYQASMGRNGFIPLNSTACELIRALYEVDMNNQTISANWTYVPPWNTDPPFCDGNRFTRDNHNGNADMGFPISFNWTIPDSIIHERCVLRLRYNISTYDYDAWADEWSTNPPANLTQYNNTYTDNNNANRNPAKIDIWSKYGLTYQDVQNSFDPSTNDRANELRKKSRDYVLQNNPRVDIFGDALIKRDQATAGQYAMIRLQLATNTNQFGRTFEDRSHRFAIRQRPNNMKHERIHNLQVLGKRGNIVQVYPGTEYDFWPKFLRVQNGEWVHFQWTGSNNNPDNNAGRGSTGTDRHNVMLLRAPVYKYISDSHVMADSKNKDKVPTIGDLYNTYPTRVDASNNTFLGFNKDDIKTLALYGRTTQFGGDMDQGDDTSTYFDLGPKQATLNGIFNYACLRNNDFSNRDQKAQIYVSDTAAKFAALGRAGGRLVSDDGDTLIVPPDAFTDTVTVSMLTAKPSAASSFDGTVGSNFVTITPVILPLAPGATVHIMVKYDDKVLVTPQLYRSDTGLMVRGPKWMELNIITDMLRPMLHRVVHMSYRLTSIGVLSSVSFVVPSHLSRVSLD